MIAEVVADEVVTRCSPYDIRILRHLRAVSNGYTASRMDATKETLMRPCKAQARRGGTPFISHFRGRVSCSLLQQITSIN